MKIGDELSIQVRIGTSYERRFHAYLEEVMPNPDYLLVRLPVIYTDTIEVPPEEVFKIIQRDWIEHVVR